VVTGDRPEACSATLVLLNRSDAVAVYSFVSALDSAKAATAVRTKQATMTHQRRRRIFKPRSRPSVA
jgi:hypothetical protein